MPYLPVRMCTMSLSLPQELRNSLDVLMSHRIPSISLCSLSKINVPMVEIGYYLSSVSFMVKDMSKMQSNLRLECDDRCRWLPTIEKIVARYNFVGVREVPSLFFPQPNFSTPKQTTVGLAMPRYQVSLWAEGIKFGCFRKPNCYAVLENGEGNEIGQTETMEAERDPDWVKILFIDADEARFVPLKVKVYHKRKHDSDLLGEASFEATEVNNATGHTMSKVLEGDTGTVSISVVESDPKTTGKVKLHFRGLDIRNVEPGLLGLGRSDPFFEIAKKTSQASTGITRWNVVYRSEVVDDHLNPFWKAIEIGLEELCDGDLDARLRVGVFDSRDGGHEPIGSFEASLQQISETVGIKGNADREKAFELGQEQCMDTFGLICVLVCDITYEDD